LYIAFLHENSYRLLSSLPTIKDAKEPPNCRCGAANRILIMGLEIGI
jgi:hypothetical protein